jgi:hypothetical protein
VFSEGDVMHAIINLKDKPDQGKDSLNFRLVLKGYAKIDKNTELPKEWAEAWKDA